MEFQSFLDPVLEAALQAMGTQKAENISWTKIELLAFLLQDSEHSRFEEFLQRINELRRKRGYLALESHKTLKNPFSRQAAPKIDIQRPYYLLEPNL